VWASADRFRDFEVSFFDDAAQGRLPSYSFIEPRYFSDGPLRQMPSDQHPPHNIAYGERLLARVYDALRHSPCWKQTLFIVTYDEHGGLYDHVVPPAAVAPDGHNEEGFAFDRYGVRVPTVIISPQIPKGTIVRPPADSEYPFDHTSILATLHKLFDLNGYLTARDAAAPDLLHVLSDDSASNDGPSTLPMPSITPTDAELAAAHAAPPNHLQTALAELAAHLPAGIADVPGHVGNITANPPVAATYATVAEALAAARTAWQKFLGQPASPLPSGNGGGAAGI
jgi:phospholipase C